MAGVALAAGGYVTSSAVYLFGMKEYKPIVRPAILTGFLGYFLVVLGLLVDLGRPWRLPYPFVVQAGPTSALFEVALCVALYLTTLFVESTPAAFEWLGWKRWRKVVSLDDHRPDHLRRCCSPRCTSPPLGALFLITPTKLHPLWYSAHLPVHFFVSSGRRGHLHGHRREHALAPGLQRTGGDHPRAAGQDHHRPGQGGRRGAGGLLRDQGGGDRPRATTGTTWPRPWGLWFLVELLGFVLLPCVLYAVGYREKRPTPDPHLGG